MKGKIIESQSHGFKFEDIIIDFIFDSDTVKDSIKLWKKIDYTSIFDIPEYDYLSDFYKANMANEIPFSKEEFKNSLKLDIDLPISIKSSKSSKSKNKKIEFGDIQRTIKNFSLYNVKRFSLIILGYKQEGIFKTIKDVVVVNLNKNNSVIKDITKFAKRGDGQTISEIKQLVDSVKFLPRGTIEKEVKAKLRKDFKEYFQEQLQLTPLIKIDSKNQRRVQCSIKKIAFINSQNEQDRRNTKILLDFVELNNIKIESSVRKIGKK